jgi:hypothetical protein
LRLPTPHNIFVAAPDKLQSPKLTSLLQGEIVGLIDYIFLLQLAKKCLSSFAAGNEVRKVVNHCPIIGWASRSTEKVAVDWQAGTTTKRRIEKIVDTDPEPTRN